jgi:transposase
VGADRAVAAEVLHTGIGWVGFGCGMTAWRRLRAWQEAGVWERLHGLLLAALHAAGEIEWARAVADSSHVQAKKGLAERPVTARRQTEHGSGLGRHRWVVERSFAWLHRRRLLLRTDRRHETHEAFLALACCLICWHRPE